MQPPRGKTVLPFRLLGAGFFLLTLTPARLEAHEPSNPLLEPPRDLRMEARPVVESHLANVPRLRWTRSGRADLGYEWRIWAGEQCVGEAFRKGASGPEDDEARLRSPLPPGTYCWQARALGKGARVAKGAWSRSQTFVVSCATLADPDLLTAAGTSCAGPISTLDDTPTLVWSDVAGESGYEWEVLTGIECTGSVAASGSTLADDTSVTLAAALPTGTYHWRVRAIGDGSSTCSSSWVCGCPFTVGTPDCEGTVLVNEYISTDMTWDLAGSPWILEGWNSVASGVTLTVDPGVVVKFRPNADLGISGGFVVNGTAAAPVVFTSIHDSSACGPSPGGSGTPANGDWTSIGLGVDAPSSIAHAIVRYGEAFSIGSDSNLVLANSRFEHLIWGLAIWFEAEPTLSNVETWAAPIEISGNARPTFLGGTWDGAGTALSAGSIIYTDDWVGGTPDPTFIGVTLQNMAATGRVAMDVDARHVFGGVRGATHWSGLSFWFPTDIAEAAIAESGQVEATDTTLMFWASEPMGGVAGLTIRGSLILTGNAAEPVTVRAGTVASSAVGWAGFNFQLNAQGDFNGVTIENANSAAWIEDSAAVTIADSTIRHGFNGVGIAGGSLAMESTSIENVMDSVLVFGLSNVDLGGGPLGSVGGNSLLAANTGVRYGSPFGGPNPTSPTSARNNWWGCSATAEMDAGLTNITRIVDQHDDPAFGLVDFSNWLGGAESRTISAVPDTQAGARDVVLAWPGEPTGALTVSRGTTPTALTAIGTTSSASYRDVGALDLPAPVVFWSVDGPCP